MCLFSGRYTIKKYSASYEDGFILRSIKYDNIKKTTASLILVLIASFVAITSKAENGKFEQAKKYLNDGILTYNEKSLHDAKRFSFN